jgi:hypothetical protein
MGCCCLLRQNMKILIYIALCFVCLVSARAQITVYLPPAFKEGHVYLFSYYPNNTKNQPLSQANVTEGIAIVDVLTLKEGIYSIYYAKDDLLQEFPFIDVVIDSNEHSHTIFWNPANNYVFFDHAPQSFLLNQSKFKWNLLQQQLKFHTDNQLVFSDNGLLNKRKDALGQSINAQLKELEEGIKNNSTQWDNYLMYLNNSDESAYLSTFWNNLTANESYLFHTPLMNWVLNKWWTGQKKLHENELSHFEGFIDSLLFNIGKTEEGIVFIDSWINTNYDYNSTNTYFVIALKKMLQLKKASENQLIAWESKLLMHENFKIGQPFDIPIPIKPLIKTKDSTVVLLFYSNSCGSCKEVFEQLKSTTLKVIAICTKCEIENKLIEEDKYPEIVFYHPEEKDNYLKYVTRGTPSLYYLKYENSTWIIEEMN